MKKVKGLVVISMVLIFAMVCAGPAMAVEKATKDECVAKVTAAAELAKNSGLDAVIAEIGKKDGAFVWKDSYVFAINPDTGKVVAHPIKPKLVGKMLTGLKDVNGKMFFIEFISTGKEKGQGWVDYMWPKPGEKKPSPKETYVYKVPDQPILILAGIYK